MTKDEYIKWKATRGNAGEWEHADCVAADNLIKHVTLTNFMTHLEGVNKEIAALALGHVLCHFGSVEVDRILLNLKCYPDWI